MYSILFWKGLEKVGGWDGMGIGVLSGPVGAMDQESYADGRFKGPEMHQKIHSATHILKCSPDITLLNSYAVGQAVSSLAWRSL
jgi:hypothetical protein